MATPSEVQTHQADGFGERDPGDLTISEMYGHHQADETEIAPESNDVDDPAAPPALPVECEYCGDDFTGDNLRERRAELHPEACLGCASDNHLELTADESNDLAEQYWSRRYDA